jgi:hypothetical protein
MYKPLTKVELHRQIKKLLADQERGISINLFAELCGISRTQLKEVFIADEVPMSEVVQTRVNKGYDAWKSGQVKVMRRKDNSRFVDYRKEPQPVSMPSLGLKVANGQIKLRVGMVNRHDYSQRDLNGD